MSSIQIRSGAGPELLADWKHLLRHRRDPLKPIVVIVPSPTVADWLRTRMPLVNVKIVTWTDWLWDLMPSHFRRWPVDAEHILESILPPRHYGASRPNPPGSLSYRHSCCNRMSYTKYFSR